MQWNNSDYQQQPQQDVYADIRPSYSGFGQEQETQEFSLSSIQERLGMWNTTEEKDVVTSPDLRPSEQTLKMSYQREYAVERTSSAIRLNTKTKVAIASYVVVVLALVLAVTLCATSVTTIFGKAANLNVDYAGASAALEETIAKTQQDNYDELDQRSADLGYVDADSSNTLTYTELETRPAQNFKVDSNWFDALCDWLCRIFGA